MEMRHEEKLLEALLEKGLISLERAQEALMQFRSSGRSAAEMLVETGAVTEDVLIAFLARAVKTAPIDVTKFPVRRDLIALLPPEIMAVHRLLPMERIGSSLTVAVMNPFDESAKKAAGDATGLRVKFVVTGPRMLNKRLQEILPGGLPKTEAKEAEEPVAEAPSVPSAKTGKQLPSVPEIDRDLDAVPLFTEDEPTSPEPQKETPKPVRARVVRKTEKLPAAQVSAPPPRAAAKEMIPAGPQAGILEREEILEAALERYASPRAEPMPSYLEGLFPSGGSKRKKKRKRK